MAATVILGIDLGEKRVGLALGDTETKLAKPIAALSGDKDSALKEIILFLKQHDIAHVVFGLPLSAGGHETVKSESVRKFGRRLERRVEGLNVAFHDEYLSSEEAKQRLIEAGKDVRKHRESGMLDSIAASIVLQEFLDQLNR